ncbi:zinc finger protein ZFP2-like [Centropristis striata]|uniref:zinc finger protein ZFP2-like n=1 Tax=Centropristis striata TaxID=184440 RepID=UPI0027E07F14|nr:zinc finger protein ZFP2-like [Centropristis striata]
MTTIESLRQFVSERLAAAAEEIFGVIEQTVVVYEEEIDRQRKLLDIVWKPKVKLHRIELQQQHLCKEEEVLAGQPLCIQESNSSPDQEDPDPPQNKGEQQELCTGQEGEQLVLKQETDASMLTPTHEESDHGEAQTVNLSIDKTQNAVEEMPAESQDQNGGQHGDSGSARNAEPQLKRRLRKNRSHSNNVNNADMSEIHRRTRTELQQQHICKEDEVLASQEGEQLVLKQQTDASMLTPTHEESDHGEAQTVNLSIDKTQNAVEEMPAESQDQNGGQHGDSGSARNAEPQLKRRLRKNRSHSNNVNNADMSEIHRRTRTELQQQHICKEDEVLAGQEGEQLVLKQQTDASMLTPTHEESDHGEAQTVNLSIDKTQNAVEEMPAESQDQNGGQHGDSGSARNAEPQLKRRLRKNRSHSNNVNNADMSEIHRRTQTGKKPIECYTCGKYFKYNYLWKLHTRVHTNERPNSCETCGKHFKSNYNLTVHMTTHSVDKQYLCKTCGKRFRTPTTLTRHIRTHTGKKPYLCKTCRKRFTAPTALIRHIRTHTGEKQYTCKTCGTHFRREAHLTDHIRSHTGEKPYLCNTCGKRFSVQATLIRHIRTHTDEKPYRCKTCGTHFGREDHLTVHIRSHTGEKPYLCNTCGKSFSEPTTLTRHIRTHTGEKPYTCTTCGKDFSRDDTLRVHMRSHTGEKPYLCKTCGKRFSALITLTRHIRTHTGQKVYTCKTCHKDFRQKVHLKVHIRTHTGEKPYSCKTCGKCFTVNAQLKVHMRRAHTDERQNK